VGGSVDGTRPFLRIKKVAYPSACAIKSSSCVSACFGITVTISSCRALKTNGQHASKDTI
jgi:hypothetical protein